MTTGNASDRVRQQQAGMAPITAAQASEALLFLIRPHEGCKWEQVGPCVYCVDHDVRLYQGGLPDDRRTVPKCVEHDWDGGDSESQCGFYLRCLRCGEQEWTE